MRQLNRDLLILFLTLVLFSLFTSNTSAKETTTESTKTMNPKTCPYRLWSRHELFGVDFFYNSKHAETPGMSSVDFFAKPQNIGGVLLMSW